MKKRYFCVFLICLTCFLFAKENEVRYVAVEKVFVKSGTGFFSKKLAELSYGQEVILIEENGKQSKVAVADEPSIIGWLSTSSLTSKKIVVRDNKSVSTNADELALAGKGFSQEVEEAFKNETSIDFSIVDKIEDVNVTDSELLIFIQEGQLEGAE